MSNRYSPTVRRRRLSEELRRLRFQSGMTLEEAAHATELARSTVGNIESGEKKRPQVAEIRALLDAYKVSGEREREAVLNLCRQSRERGWWSRYKDVLPGRFIGLEAEASVISNWEPLVIPGLLQVPEYVETTSRALLVGNPADIQRAVDARIERQRILVAGEDRPALWAVFDEGALLRLADYPDVRRAQIDHLIHIAEEPNNVTIQMTPSNRLNPGSAGAFVIMDFPDTVDPSVVYLETDTDGLYLEGAEEIARYRTLFDHLRLAALKPGETIVRLREMTE